MNKYKDYLDEAYKEYGGFAFEDLLFELNAEKERLKLIELALGNEEHINIFNERDKEISVIYPSFKKRKELFELLIENSKTNIKLLKAIIIDKLEKGGFLEDD